jgi:hypothetical protein
MPSPRPTILILVLSVDRDPWREIEIEGQRTTWASSGAVPPGCEIVFYYGAAGLHRLLGGAIGRMTLTPGANPVSRSVRRLGERLVPVLSRHSVEAEIELRGDRLLTRVPEAHRFTLAKLLSALRWATAPGMPRFDYVYRTNSSSYLALPRLQEVIASLPKTGCYAGFIGKIPSTQLEFASGSGVLMSWDVATEAGATVEGWNWNLVDDAALGTMLAARGIHPRPLSRVNLEGAEEVEALSEEVLLDAFHFRCKASGDDGLRGDVEIMRALHDRLSNDLGRR